MIPTTQKIVSDRDERGNEIHAKYDNDYEWWTEYNEDDKQVYFRDIGGTREGGKEVWWEYDENGNEIYSKTSWGYEIWHVYDANGNMLHYHDSNGDSLTHTHVTIGDDKYLVGEFEHLFTAAGYKVTNYRNYDK